MSLSPWLCCLDCDADEISIEDDPHLSQAALLLSVNAQSLSRSITHKQIRESYAPLTCASAVASRDALAKHLYAHLFDYIVHTINFSLKGQQETLGTSFIAILDIYGFETFAHNNSGACTMVESVGLEANHLATKPVMSRLRGSSCATLLGDGCCLLAGT